MYQHKDIASIEKSCVFILQRNKRTMIFHEIEQKERKTIFHGILFVNPCTPLITKSYHPSSSFLSFDYNSLLHNFILISLIKEPRKK